MRSFQCLLLTAALALTAACDGAQDTGDRVEELGENAKNNVEAMGESASDKASALGEEMKVETQSALKKLESEFDELVAEAKALGVDSKREVEAARLEVKEALRDFGDPDSDSEKVGEELGEALDHYRKAISEAKEERQN